MMETRELELRMTMFGVGAATLNELNETDDWTDVFYWKSKYLRFF